MAAKKTLSVKKAFFDTKALYKDVKKYKIITAFFIISLIFFFAGVFIEKEVMKYAAIGIIILGGLSVHMTWAQPHFVSEHSALFNVAVATSHSFLFLGFLLCVLFIIDQFIFSVENITFAIFGSVLLSIIVASLYLTYKLRKYM